MAAPVRAQEAPPASAEPAANVAPGVEQNASPAATAADSSDAGAAAAAGSGAETVQNSQESAGQPPQPSTPPVQPSSQAEAAGANQTQLSAEPIDATAPATNVDANAEPASPAAQPSTRDNRQTPGQTQQNLPHDLSPWSMFLAADVIVKGVMILLAVASVLAWSIWFGKVVQVSFSMRRLSRGMEELDGYTSLGAAAEPRRPSASPLAVMIAAANDEVTRSQGGLMPASGIKERVASHLSRIEASAGRAMTSGTGILATIGSTAPFIGLFGTVWGIMNSFIGISQAQTTNLAVVAPGIAEALLATGIGLVAAIPAVIFYNQLARSISGYKAKLADCGAMVERLLSRDLDHQAVRTPYLKAGE